MGLAARRPLPKKALFPGRLLIMQSERVDIHAPNLDATTAEWPHVGASRDTREHAILRARKVRQPGRTVIGDELRVSVHLHALVDRQAGVGTGEDVHLRLGKPVPHLCQMGGLAERLLGKPHPASDSASPWTTATRVAPTSTHCHIGNAVTWARRSGNCAAVCCKRRMI